MTAEAMAEVSHSTDLEFCTPAVKSEGGKETPRSLA